MSENHCYKRGGVVQNWGKGVCLKIGGYHVIMRFFWRFLMMQHMIKIFIMFIFPLTNMCYKTITQITYERIGIEIALIVLI